MKYFVGLGGALVESMPFNRRVAGSNPVALWYVNSDTVSIAVVESASEKLMLWLWEVL